MKWIFYVVVIIYMCYRTVQGARLKTISSLSVDPVDYSKYGNYLPPGSVKTIPCKYNNKNQQVEWLDPSGKPIPQIKTHRIFTQKHLSQTLHGDRVPSLLLSFTDTSVEDSGEYECRSDGLSETISLCVIDPLTFVDTPSEVNVDEGRSFTLTCEARGRPEPRLVWYRNDEIITDDCNSTKYKVMTKFNSQGFQGQLTITSIEPEDAGEYVCEAIQEHKNLDDCTISKNWNITLNVNFPPIFEDGNITVLFAKENESVDFDCEPKAYPAPTFRWFSEVNEGTLLAYPQEKVVTSENGTKSKVTIVADAVSFGIKHFCRASNSFGDAAKTFVVLKMVKPKQPDEVNFLNNTDTQIDLNVTWLDEVRFPIEDIQFQYMKEGNRRRLPKEYEWKRAAIKTFELTELDEEAIKLIVSGLEPDTDYWIRLRAVNEIGLSPWSYPILASTAAEEEEEPAEQNEEVTTDESTEADVEPKVAQTESMFYGILFAGAVLVASFLCVFFMR